ncbi:hypothetical protein NDU88_003361 [Pleurodeles waltl]|uniref:Uncharacterized protein n=1 Tax=Pleurodeles waltl TaxID=8319 RepID=A0AAV7KUL0_PLEWA|nr:hypothetical protein NDU88_003361 [Pleurodeles waltl]
MRKGCGGYWNPVAGKTLNVIYQRALGSTSEPLIGMRSGSGGSGTVASLNDEEDKKLDLTEGSRSKLRRMMVSDVVVESSARDRREATLRD